jgi:hypothetical protein
VLLFAFAVIVHRARASRACAIVTADGDEPGRLRDPEQTIYIDRGVPRKRPKITRDARQGEVGLVVGDEYFAIRDFAEG